jgi:hypothetical protein
MVQATALVEQWQKDTIEIGDRSLSVWPAGQEVFFFSEQPRMLETHFSDADVYQQRLIERILELEQDPEFTHRMHIGGSKIRDVHRWGIPEADLVYSRAAAFHSLLTGNPNPVVELSWANVSRHGEWLSPHSHNDCIGSAVYCLDPGDPDPDNPLSGRLSFADPRIEGCCTSQADCVTREVVPDLKAGTMALFPSQLVHYVHPYTGRRPRITLAFNLR